MVGGESSASVGRGLLKKTIKFVNRFSSVGAWGTFYLIYNFYINTASHEQAQAQAQTSTGSTEDDIRDREAQWAFESY